jgi:hypothetical protein
MGAALSSESLIQRKSGHVGTAGDRLICKLAGAGSRRPLNRRQAFRIIVVQSGAGTTW